MKQITGQTLGRLGQLYGSLQDDEKLLMEKATWLEDIVQGIKVTTLICQMNFLRMLVRQQASTNKIKSLADKIVLGSEIGGLRSFWERQILHQRINMKQSEIVKAKQEWGKMSSKIDRFLGPERSYSYRMIKKDELNYVWKTEANEG